MFSVGYVWNSSCICSLPRPWVAGRAKIQQVFTSSHEQLWFVCDILPVPSPPPCLAIYGRVISFFSSQLFAVAATVTARKSANREAPIMSQRHAQLYTQEPFWTTNPTYYECIWDLVDDFQDFWLLGMRCRVDWLIRENRKTDVSHSDYEKWRKGKQETNFSPGSFKEELRKGLRGGFEASVGMFTYKTNLSAVKSAL